MSNNRLCRWLPAWLWLCSIIASQRIGIESADGSERRNVLFVVFDDLGSVWDTKHGLQFATPNLDRLRRSGTYFSRAYCQIPLCNPSRASMLTGMRPDHTGVWDLDRHFRSTLPEVQTLPQIFREHGYKVARIGKIFHYDVPNQIGTDGLDDAFSWDEVSNPKGRDVADADQIVNPTPEKPISAALSWLAADGTDGEQTDGMIASQAVEFLTAHRDTPFFLGVGFFRPHTPFVAPKQDFNRIPLDQVGFKRDTLGNWSKLLPASIPHNIRQADYGLSDAELEKALQGYAASISFADRQLGRILDGLEQNGLSRNTIVVACSDHGYHLGEHGLWQKRTLFNPSARTPLFVRFPGYSAGNDCAAVVELVDILPTVVELAFGDQVGQNALSLYERDGRSLEPLMKDTTIEWPFPAFTQILRPGGESMILGRAVTLDSLRYVEWNEGRDGVELYDLQNDPDERNNLANRPDFADRIQKLKLLFDGKASGLPPTVPVNRARL